MRVIKNAEIVEDGWHLVADDAPLPDADAIVSFRRWSEQKDILIEHPRRLAICVAGDDDIDAVATEARQFDLIALHFPQFKDGRNYSNARLLRDRFGYEGELRAVGEVLRDQIFFMRRCGIDSFAVPEDRDIEAALAGFGDFSLAYQPATYDDVPVFRFRRR